MYCCYACLAARQRGLFGGRNRDNTMACAEKLLRGGMGMRVPTHVAVSLCSLTTATPAAAAISPAAACDAVGTAVVGLPFAAFYSFTEERMCHNCGIRRAAVGSGNLCLRLVTEAAATIRKRHYIVSGCRDTAVRGHPCEAAYSAAASAATFCNREAKKPAARSSKEKFAVSPTEVEKIAGRAASSVLQSVSFRYSLSTTAAAAARTCTGPTPARHCLAHPTHCVSPACDAAAVSVLAIDCPRQHSSTLSDITTTITSSVNSAATTVVTARTSAATPTTTTTTTTWPPLAVRAPAFCAAFSTSRQRAVPAASATDAASGAPRQCHADSTAVVAAVSPSTREPRSASSRSRLARVQSVSTSPATAATTVSLLSLPEFFLRRSRRFPRERQQQAAFDLAVIFEHLSALSCSPSMATLSAVSAATAAARSSSCNLLDAPRESDGVAALPAAAGQHASAAASPATSSLPTTRAAPTDMNAAAAVFSASIAPVPYHGAAHGQHNNVGNLFSRKHSRADALHGDPNAGTRAAARNATVGWRRGPAATARRLWSAAVETAKANSDLLQVSQLLSIIHAAARASISIPSFASKMRQRALQVAPHITNPHAFLRLLLDLEKLGGLNDRQLLLFRDAIAARLLRLQAEAEQTRERHPSSPERTHISQKADVDEAERVHLLVGTATQRGRQTRVVETASQKVSSRAAQYIREERGTRMHGAGTKKDALFPSGPKIKHSNISEEREETSMQHAVERAAVMKHREETLATHTKAKEDSGGSFHEPESKAREAEVCIHTAEQQRRTILGSAECSREVMLLHAHGRREGRREKALLRTVGGRIKEQPHFDSARSIENINEASHAERKEAVLLRLHAQTKKEETVMLRRPAPPFVVVMLLQLLAKHRIRDRQILLHASNRLLQEETVFVASLRQTPALLPLEAGGCCRLLLGDLLEKHAFPLLSELRVQELLNLAYALVCLHTHSTVRILHRQNPHRQQPMLYSSHQQQKRPPVHQPQCTSSSTVDDWQRQPPPQQEQLGVQRYVQQQGPDHEAQQQQHRHTVAGERQQFQEQVCEQQGRSPHRRGSSCIRGGQQVKEAGDNLRTSLNRTEEPLSTRSLPQKDHAQLHTSSEVSGVKHTFHVRERTHSAPPTEDHSGVTRATAAVNSTDSSITRGGPKFETKSHLPFLLRAEGNGLSARSSSASPVTADRVAVSSALFDTREAAVENNAVITALGSGACIRPTACGNGRFFGADELAGIAAAPADSHAAAVRRSDSPAVASGVARALDYPDGSASLRAAAAATTSVAFNTASKAADINLYKSMKQRGLDDPVSVSGIAPLGDSAALSDEERGFECSSGQLRLRSLLLTATLRLLLQRLRRDGDAKATAANGIAWRQLKFVDAYIAHSVGPLRVVEHEQQLERPIETAHGQQQEWPERGVHSRQVASGYTSSVRKDIASLLLQARHKVVDNVVRISELQKRVGSMLLHQNIEGLVVEQPLGPFVLDFAIPSKRVAVEIDGEAHFYLHTNVPTARTRFKRELLTAMGWRVVVVPEELWKQKGKTQVKTFVTRMVEEALKIPYD